MLSAYSSVGDSYKGTTPLMALGSGDYQDLIVVSNNPNFASPVPEA